MAVVDAWDWLLDHAEASTTTAPTPDGGAFRGRLDTPDGKAAWVGGAPKAALLAATPEHQRLMLDALADSVRCALPSDLAKHLYRRPAEWASLVAQGMRVGVHSVQHPDLTGLDDRALAIEVRESVATVADLCAPVTFACPDGAFDARVIEQAPRAGVSSAVTCEPGVVRRGSDPMCLPRRFVATPGHPL